MTDLLTSWPAFAAELLLALTGVGLGLRMLYSRWTREGVAIAESRTSTVEAHARTEIVEQLKNELTRLSGQRLLVSDQLLSLQKTVLDLTAQAANLTTQVALLTTENVALKAEIVQLRAEVTRLHQVAS